MAHYSASYLSLAAICTPTVNLFPVGGLSGDTAVVRSASLSLSIRFIKAIPCSLARPRFQPPPAASSSPESDRELLRKIERAPGQRAGYKQLVRELGLGGGRERRLLVEHLARLTASGKLIKPDRDHWMLPPAKSSSPTRPDSPVPGENLIAGKLDLHRDGFGFVRPKDRSAAGNDDIFIPPNELNGAMQGDTVLVAMAPPRHDGRRFGRIRRVLTRNNPSVVGRFHYARGHNQNFGGNYITPMDGRMADAILIPPGMERPLTAHTPHRVLGTEAERHETELLKAVAEHPDRDLEGLIVDVQVTDWPTPTRPARGRVIEILGHEDDFGVDVEIVIRKHHLPHQFPENVLEEARAVAHLDPEEIGRRRDFRDLPIVTIDGETAKDFDDAVLVQEHADGTWALQVHIADVAQYVQPGTPLDLEARIRGNSVYFPDRAIPMLPQELSTDICSLRPNEDRLVLSCLMQIDAEGEITGYEITEGVIRSARRVTYTQVHEILTGNAIVRAEFAELVPAFQQMERLAHILNKKRDRRGSIDFDLPEPVIQFDELGAMTDVIRAERTWANRLIEEFMLSANECVASWLENLGVPSLYRIHEVPDPRRVMDFEDAAAHFGYSLGLGALPVKKFRFKSERREHLAKKDRFSSYKGNARTHEVPEHIPVTSQMYQRLSRKLAGKPEERILSHLMLRSLKQARYSEKNEGHFALAAPAYTHFTSPIRRYPDLIIHRICKALLHEGVSGHSKELSSRPKRSEVEGPTSVTPPLSETELAAIAQETSETERRAADAERELIEWKKVKFMQDRVGEDFDAIVLNATKYGLFVELDAIFIEGLVPMESLSAADPNHETFTYRENTRQIISAGRHGLSKRYSAGDRIHVVLERIDAVERRLQFGIYVDLETLNAAMRKPKKSSAKKADKKSKQNESAQAKGKSKNSGKNKGKRKRK
jgi:ribonuclease R